VGGREESRRERGRAEGRKEGRKEGHDEYKISLFRSPEHAIYIRYSKQLDYLFPPFDTIHLYDNDVNCCSLLVTLCHATCEELQQFARVL
jgi:hypothetical protein